MPRVRELWCARILDPGCGEALCPCTDRGPPEAASVVMALMEAIRASSDGAGVAPFGGRLALTVPEASHALGLSPNALRTIIRRGDLHTVAFGRATRISVRELTDYLDRRAGEAKIYAQPMQIGRSARIRTLGRS